ncbi:MAG: serine/threonine protein kinase [Phycisphaerales bacterium]|nr:serine/threonine protein kinase [Phycisphaerales bacterium]
MGSERSSADCPDAARLESVADGDCADAALNEHVRGCAACRRAVQEIRENREFLFQFGAGPGVTLGASTGPLVDGYQTLGEVARGGQGIIYKALQTATRRRVALKVPTSDALSTVSGRRRFEQEIALVAGLRHPYIVTLYDRGLTRDGRVFVAMEYVSGERLDHWAQRLERRAQDSATDPQAAVRAKLEVMAKVCEAVQYAHQRGIMHRDLKPGNILVDAEDRPRLLDFGIARLLVPGGLHQTLTGEFVGTPAYASPEQVSGDGENVDTRTDVYSLGVVLYELLLGRLPYPDSGSSQRMIEHIRGTEPERPWARTSARGRGPVDGELGTILLKALAKDRERRYQTAVALGADLRRYLAGEAIEAKRDSTWYVLRKAARRHRTLVVAAAVVLIAVGVGIGTAAYGLARASGASERESAERARAQSETEKLEAIGQILREVMPPATARLIDTESPERRALTVLDEKLAAGLMQEQPLLEAAVRTMMSSIYLDHGVLNWAESHARIALRLREQASGQDTAETALGHNFLAEVLLAREKYDDAQRNAERALASRQRLWGAEHRDVAQSLDTLARIRLARGDMAGAARDAAAALGMRRRLFGAENHPDVAASLDTVAEVAVRAGTPGAAEPAAREALIMRYRLFSDEHPDVVRSLDRLAEVARAKGEQARAADLEKLVGQLRGSVQIAGRSEMRRAVVELKRELIGPDDPETAQSLMLLGAGQMADNDFPGAERTLREALLIYERAFGPDHLLVAECMEPLSLCLWRMNRYGETLECRRRRARIYTQELGGKDDMGVCVIRREYAWTLSCVGRDEESIRELSELLSYAEEHLGPDDYETSRARAYLGEVYAAMGRWSDAEPLARRAMEAARAYPQAPAIEFQTRALVLGAVLGGLNRWEEAAPLMVDGEKILSVVRTVHEHDPHNRVLQRVAAMFDEHGDPARAARFRAAAAASHESGL